MQARLSLLAAVSVLAGSAAAHTAEFKSPGPGMHFTVGQPLKIWADLGDSNNNHGFIINGVGWPQLQILVDGALQIDAVTQSDTVPGSNQVDQNGNPSPADYYPFTVTGLAVGTHQVVVRGKFPPPPYSNGATQDSAPIAVVVDSVPSGKTPLTLSADVNGPVNWNNLIVVGNGHVVHASGALVIRDSLIIGLGSETADGIDGTVTSATIERSIFEATGAVSLRTSGDAAIRDNEFRANNLLRFSAPDPDASPIFTIKGATSPLKYFQGNRVGAGRVAFDGVANWLVGGDTDATSNIFMGPRCSLHFQNGVSQVVLRGNYMHHNYRGGWSQGFNLDFTCNFCGLAGGDHFLAEHNFIRGGSWPVQSLVGEFRYNVVYGYGHTWIRGALAGASIHHNLFAPEGGGGLNEGVSIGSDGDGVQIYNNTFDGGGNVTGDFAGPTMGSGADARVDSLRNNLIAFSRNYENSPGEPRVVGDAGTLLSADYNAFYSPDNTTHDNYDVAGLVEGVTPGFAIHDVSGTGAMGVPNGQLAASPFAGARVYPLEAVVDEGAVWQRTQKLSTILALFRARYMPKAASPIVNTADPQDNDAQTRRADIGAIDLDGHEQDRLGKFGLIAPVTFVKGDVDSDGSPDLVFRSATNGARNKIWFMNGVARASEALVTPEAASADWLVRGMDDFNSDSRNDLVFWNQATGAVEFWLMNGAARVGAPVPLGGAAILPTSWDLAATGDFSGDGKPDIVWRNLVSQNLVIWTMNGTTRLGAIVPTPAQAVDGNWSVVAALDYNDDGLRDLLWYNFSSGRLVTWYLNAAVVRTSGQFTTPMQAGDSNWRVVGGGDYSKTNVPATPPLGSNDVVWRNATSGNQVIWHMDFASTRVYGEFTAPPANTPALEWTVVGPR